MGSSLSCWVFKGDRPALLFVLKTLTFAKSLCCKQKALLGLYSVSRQLCVCSWASLVHSPSACTTPFIFFLYAFCMFRYTFFFHFYTVVFIPCFSFYPQFFFFFWPLWLLQNTRTSLLALASVPLRYGQFRNFHFFSVTCSHNALLQTYSNGCIYFIVFISMLLLVFYVFLPHLPWQIWKSGVSSLTKLKRAEKKRGFLRYSKKALPQPPKTRLGDKKHSGMW